ncbi:hypothetical protein ACFL96_15615 [Thermoproteota archaeon]
MSIRKVRPILLKRGRNRAARPKTFKTEAAANTWAKAEGLKQFEIEELSMPSAKQKKFRVVE